MSNEWIDWGGGECPVDGDTLVDVKFLDGGEELRESADYWRWGFDQGSSRIIAYRLSQSEKVPPAPVDDDGGWIKCSGRMPDEGTEVLCGSADGSLWIARRDRGRWDDGDWHHSIQGITHWQPLPAPPKGE